MARQLHRLPGHWEICDRCRGSGGTYLMTAKIPAGQDPAASKQALEDHYTRWGCSHEYDCCGCVSTRARVKQITARTFSVAIDYSRNY